MTPPFSRVLCVVCNFQVREKLVTAVDEIKEIMATIYKVWLIVLALVSCILLSCTTSCQYQLILVLGGSVDERHML
jgi:hypothetical protein